MKNIDEIVQKSMDLMDWMFNDIMRLVVAYEKQPTEKQLSHINEVYNDYERLNNQAIALDK